MRAMPPFVDLEPLRRDAKTQSDESKVIVCIVIRIIPTCDMTYPFLCDQKYSCVLHDSFIRLLVT